MTNDEQAEEYRRQSLLLESLEQTEAFREWRKEICDPMLERLDALIAGSDTLTEPVLRANVKLRYLVKEMFYRIFDEARFNNRQEQ